MKLEDLLQNRGMPITARALDAMRRAHLAHYEALGQDRTRDLVESLFETTRKTIVTRSAKPMLAYVDQITEERFTHGFDLLEVQTAFNALEESIWKEVTDTLAAPDLAEALGLVSTVLGMGKDGLARGFVARATKTKAPSLDLRALFSGT